MRTLTRLFVRLFLGAGWLLFLIFACLFVAEKSGLLTTLVRDLLAQRAGSLGADISIEHVTLRWFEPALEIEGLALGPRGDSVLLEHVRLSFEIAAGHGTRLARADVDGGQVRISPALINGLQGFTAEVAKRREMARATAVMPAVHVQNLQVDYDTSRFGRLPVGRVEVLLRGDANGLPVLSGRLIPSLAPVNTPEDALASRSGEIYLSGHESKPGEFEVRAAATGVPLSTDHLPQGTVLDGARAFQPRGVLGLEAQGRFRLDGSIAPRATARLVLSDGVFVAAAGAQTFDAVRLDLDASYAPVDRGDLAGISAWEARAHASGRYQGQPFEITTLLGSVAGAGQLTKSWLHLPRLALSHALIELFGAHPENEVRWSAFDPRGTAEVWACAVCPRDWAPSEKLADKLAFGLELGFDGQAGMTYHGWPNPRTRQTDLGFPLPIDHIAGGVLFARNPRRLRPAMLGLVDLAAKDGSGTIHCNGLLTSHAVDVPPYQPGYGFMELDIHLATDRLANDDRLRMALRGLSGAVHPAETWERFNPSGGIVAVDLRLLGTVDRNYVATHLRLGLEDVDLAWAELPIPVGKARGHLEFISDGHSEGAIGFSAEGTLRTAQRMKIAARYQTDADMREARDAGHRIDATQLVALDVERMSLTGDDKKILVAQYPVIGSAMDAMAPKGFADVAFRRVRDRGGASLATTAEVTPREPVQLKPRKFEMITNDVRGRVLVTAEESPAMPQDGDAAMAPSATRVETRLMPLVGNWGSDAQVAFTASFPGDALRIFGAGIDPSSKSLLGSLSKLIENPHDKSGSVDLTALHVEGMLDLRAEIPLADDTEIAPTSTYSVFLRDNSLSNTGNFRLDGLRGVLELRDKTLHGDRLSARLADTPVDLRDVRFSTSNEGFRLETRLAAHNLPLDREHLRSFVDRATLEALLGELRWRGRLDIEDGRIVISGPRQGDSRLEFSGKITPNDMFVQLGLPFAVRSASATIEELILEGGRVRGFGRIDDLYGEIAGRELGPASLLLTYVEPRLSIENLSGQFEGGEILPLGVGAARGGTVFSIDLADPFPFQLAIDLRSVDVGGLLRGLFPTNIATRGRLNCQMRLVGNIEDLLGIQGSGSIQLRETRLWSVPVFRALFSQLGFDSTAVFDRMATNIRVHNGVIEMSDIAVHSPLLQLIGKGTLDFDGALSHDLEVRYDLVDSLGPITRLLYSVQNKLLSVAIRGDMSRPEVILKNPLTRFYRSLDNRYRALPLPGYAPLPPRF